MLTPKEVAQETCNIGYAKVTKNNVQVILSALIAGMAIAFGFYGYVVIVGQTDASFLFLGKFIGALVFPVGIVLILIGGGDLFTGNCLITLGCLNKQYKFRKVLKNLSLVFLGNFLGALLFVLLLYFSNIVSGQSKQLIIEIAKKKVSLDFVEALFSGILCNIIVSMAVYISYSAKNVSGKILAVFLPVMLFVISGYEHSVANMFILPMAKALGSDITISEILLNNLLPVTIGNIIGGAVITPFLYYFVFVKHYKPKKIEVISDIVAK